MQRGRRTDGRTEDTWSIRIVLRSRSTEIIQPEIIVKIVGRSNPLHRNKKDIKEQLDQTQF